MNMRALRLTLLFWVCLSAWAGHAGEALDLDEKPGDDELNALLGEELTRDFALLQGSHVSDLTAWEQVRRSGEKAASGTVYHWQQHGGEVQPLADGAISTLIEVPESATYRVHLRHQLGTNIAFPVTLTLTPQGTPGEGKPAVFTDAGAALSHVYGQVRLSGGLTGKELEKKRPVRFESEAELLAIPSDACMAWEFWDVELKKGVYRAALANADKRVRASTLLLTRSKDFRPSLARTVGRVYMRFKVSDASAKAGTKVSVNAGLGYHWGPRAVRGSNNGAWSWPIGAAPPTAVGEWSPFIEATEAIVPGPGPWSTCNLGVSGSHTGSMEVQFAWFQHEKAVAVSVKTGVGGGRAMLRVPHGSWLNLAQAGTPAAGMWSRKAVSEVLTQESIVERYFTWATEAAAKLGIKDNHPRPKHVRLFCGCGVLPSNLERAAEMLARLGVNWIEGAPPSVIAKHGLHDETCGYNTTDAAGIAQRMSEAERKKFTKVKIGDEIGTLTDANVINADPARRQKFHAYLMAEAQAAGMDLATFLGVDDISAVDCLGHLSANPGRFERRLYYHSHRFGHLATCDEYAPVTAAFHNHFPNVRVYNNYSPHPPFLTGATMNHSDWFVLPRNKAQTLGWAEDWATGGGWGLGTAYQCTSFYAALVDCSVRKHGYPFGFYVGTNCGGSAEKIFGCVAQGATWLHLYDWGPIDRWAEGSNAWSENQSEYYAVMCAAAAIGPADEIIGKGTRERRRTAILYNRSHEIMHEGAGRMNHDWMWTYIALRATQIPVDVILEEDLNADDLKRYDCVFAGGFNLSRQHFAALKAWVQNGGLLIGTAGAAQFDLYNDPLAEAVELFGARQRPANAKEKAAVTRVTSPASELFPNAEFTPAGLTFVLEPTTGKPVATYAGGHCAAVLNTVGKGQALLLGVQPGPTFRDNRRALGNVRAWLTAPVLKRLGRQRVEFSHHASEATLFEHDSGLAVMLSSIGGPSPEGGSLLSVQTERPIKEVLSALRGPLEWKRVGDRIEVKTQRLEPVDVVILR